MADQDRDATPGPEGPEGEEVRPQEGSEAQASGPAPQDGAETIDDDELTVDDILGAPQRFGTPLGADSATGADATAEDAVIADLESQLLNDLKRLQAEYANYRRRTEEQREVEIERAKGSVAKGLLPVLDDLDRAEKHGDLEEGSAFAVIAEKLRGVAVRMGLAGYGEAGEPFDPQRHEAILQAPMPGVTEPTVLEVVEVGYRIGSVELRPAKVVVAVPTDAEAAPGGQA